MNQTKNQTQTIRPDFIRLPKNGERDPWTGLSRSSINALVLPTKQNGYKPPVASRVLRERGRIRGVRLVLLQSLIDYIHEQAEQPGTLSGEEARRGF